ARQHRKGLAFMHSHPGPGWQDMSRDDFKAEAGKAGAVVGATGLPFVGLTLGLDPTLSAPFLGRTRPRPYRPRWCGTVRVVGRRLAISYHPRLRPDYLPGEELHRTVGVWGLVGQSFIARPRYGIAGLGSVGSIVAETLARMGIQLLSLIDYDVIK